MLAGLYSAAAGMSAQQQALDAVGNDLANVSTTGYKAERVGFRDLLYNDVNQAGSSTTTGAGAASEIVGRDGSQGAIQDTADPLDVAIEGAGFLQFKRADGKQVLSRNGALGVDAQGRLTGDDGSVLNPPITLPKGVSPSELAIGPDGTVRAGTRALGRIELVTVPSPDHLLAEGNGQFTTTAQSGAPQTTGVGSLRQGALEGSNVDVARAMTSMMSTQRAYQLASNAIRTQDQMMSIANQLRS